MKKITAFLLTVIMIVSFFLQPLVVYAVSNADTIFDFLTTEMGLNSAAACGVLANIQNESSFNPTAVGDGGTSYGICQWHNSRYDNLKKWCSNNGYDYTSLMGQLYYLKYELNTSWYYDNVLVKLFAVSNNAQGAYDAGYAWCYYFERPASKETKSVTRGNLARDTYWPKYGNSTQGGSNTAGSVSTDIIKDRIYELYEILGAGSYFTTTHGAACGAKTRGHSCVNCRLATIITQGWFKSEFGSLSVSQFPQTYYSGGVPHGPDGWSCFGFVSFAEWYIFQNNLSDVVQTKYIGTYNYDHSNVQKYVMTGDILRLGDGAGHSAIAISCDSTGVNVLDCNWNGNYNCQVYTHKISYSSYSSFSISRAVNSTAGVGSFSQPDTYSSTNPDDYPFPTRDLFYTSPVKTGSDVAWVQAVLLNLGYSISIDGSFGPRTKEVVKQFQSDYGLDVDGSVGPATRAMLKSVINNKEVAAPRIHYWFSNTKMGESSAAYYAGEWLYLNYELYDAETGLPFDEIADKNYQVRLEIYDCNGTVTHQGDFSDDDGSIGITRGQAGTYIGKVTMTGDYIFDGEVSVQMLYDASLESNVSSVSLNLNGNNATTVVITPTGALPGEREAIVYYNESCLSVSSRWSNGQIFIDLSGIQVANTSIRVDLYEKYTGNKNVVASITVPIAVTANTYTVSYNANGGIGAPSSQTKYYGTDITLSSTVPTRSGYSFLGWSTSSTATSATYQPGSTFSSNANTTLYAVWKTNATALSANSSNSAVISTGGEKKYFTFTPSKNGIYVIYSTGSSDTRVYLYDENGTQINFNDDGGENRNFRLETVLSAGSKYTYAVEFYSSATTGTINFNFGLIYSVCYDANGGESAPGSQDKDYGMDLVLSSEIPTRDGYEFRGWATSSTATSATYQPGAVYSSNAHITLYAVWKDTDTIWYDCGETARYRYIAERGVVIIHDSAVGRMYDNFYAFVEDPGIKNANITAGSVSNYLFRDCVNLSSVTMSFVEEIGTYSFMGCTGLTTVNFSDELTTIGNHAFNECTSLTKISLPEGLTTIGAHAFSECTSLTEVTLPDGLESIDSAAFVDTGLSEITIPKSVTTIKAGAFDEGVVIYGYINSAAQAYAEWFAHPFVPLDAINIYANRDSIQGVSILSAGETQYYKFTPTTSGKYVVYSLGAEDTRVGLYDIYGNELCSDDNGGEASNFRMEYDLQGGVTYLFGFGYQDPSIRGIINVKLRSVYSVVYDSNGGTNGPALQTKEYGTNTLSTVVPTNSGYTFLGWSESSSATSAMYIPGDTILLTGDIMLYAVWKANEYTVSYDANGGSGAPSNQTKCHGTTLILSSVAPVREGYTFLGWAASSTATSANYQPGGSFTINADTTLYAIWNKDDMNLPSAYLDSTNNLSTIQTVTIKMYDDAGVFAYYWGTDSTYTNNEYRQCSFISTNINTQREVSEPGEYGLTVVDVNGNVSATYVITFYKTTLNANGGNVSTTSILTRSGSTITLPTPTRSGYTFQGWSTSPTTTDVTYQSGDTLESYANVTLYAVWEPVVPAVIIGDVNGDGVVDAGDAVLISRYDAGLVALTPDQFKAGDVNKDGTVDAGDAVVISRYDAGFIPTLN